jgi:hypothetical protein
MPPHASRAFHARLGRQHPGHVQEGGTLEPGEEQDGVHCPDADEPLGEKRIQRRI